MLTRGLKQNDGIFDSESQILEVDLPVGLTVAINESQLLQWYKVTATDLGDGIQLNNGNWITPVDSDPRVAVNTQDIENLKGLNPKTVIASTYQLLAADFDAGEVRMNNASANTVSIPLDSTELLPERTVLITQLGAGTTSIDAVAGVTLNGVDGGFVDISDQYTGAALTKISANTYIVTGNITTVA